MDETSKAIIDGITQLFNPPKQLDNGVWVSKYYNCSELAPNDLARLAALATGSLEDDIFDAVIGVAYSGILFAALLAKSKPVSIYQKDGVFSRASLSGQRVLVVDDVIHSGAHVEKAALAAKQGGNTVIGFACIVDRTVGQCLHLPALSPLPLPIWSAWQCEIAQ